MSRDFHMLAIAANRAREFDIEELNDEHNQLPSNKQNVFQCSAALRSMLQESVLL